MEPPCRNNSIEEEASPLLSGHQRIQNGCPAEENEANRGSLPRVFHRVTVLLTAVLFVITMGSGLLAIPTLRVLEDIICQRQLRVGALSGHVGENECKGDAVQAELSFVVGIQSMVEAIPSLFLAVPYGLLADRIGRRPVLALSIAGMNIALVWMMMAMRLGNILPIWTIWTSAAWQIVGGGSSVMISMVYSMIADVETADTRANAFYMVIVGGLFANLIAVPVSAQLMQHSPWIPLLGGLGLVVAGCAGVAFVPETLRAAKNPCSIPDECDGETDRSHGSFIGGVKRHLSRTMAELRSSTAMLRSGAIVALVFTFCVQGFTESAASFTVQYLSKRFHWPLSRAGMLFSVGTLINILLHLVILPGCSWIMVSPRFMFRCRPETKDVMLARSSALLLVLGSFLLAWPSLPAVVSGLVIFTLGSGFQSLCRALVTTLIDSEHTARLYTLIGVVLAFSSLASGPVIAWLFSKGLQLGGYWIGLPYFGVTLLCCIAALAVFVARLPPLPAVAE
ncbi:major facilitator superfamily protein [Hirsutella rhossiliensis]|uniref:Major facilitator superfamily domain-containing protein n=1 Tax=Hirsutella rhossiliensis TaxID=111463 RepID=A0A9P8N5E4_9HYPO|nr:major facilitator superfamily domain-containing protein [Hirsutella rhossiliensis]KAH0966266.1 major facilitator superfamily domain-containing protein [Hirsutella rhossiliensis]